MPTAFITGVTGQDGSYLAERLTSHGWHVHALIKSSQDAHGNPLPDSLELHEGDVTDANLMSGLLRSVRPDTVFNLAGISSVAASWDDPVGTISVNALAVSVILDVLWRMQVEFGHSAKFIQASSAELFGDANEVPQSERTMISPVSPYGASKALAHHMVSVYRKRGLFASSAIFYNHESPRRPAAFVTRKITSQVARIALGLDDILVLGNLDAKRDWGWAPDYVEAMILMEQHSVADDFVVASGESHTVRDFVRASFTSVGIEDWEKHVRIDPKFVRPADVGEMRGDASKARQELGWVPTISFSEIVARMVAHDLVIQRRQTVK